MTMHCQVLKHTETSNKCQITRSQRLNLWKISLFKLHTMFNINLLTYHELFSLFDISTTYL